MSYQRKTTDEYQIQQFTGKQWELVTCADNWKEARGYLRDYKQNEPELPVRMRKVRIPVEQEIQR